MDDESSRFADDKELLKLTRERYENASAALRQQLD